MTLGCSYTGKIFYYFRKYLKNDAQAEDLMQEVFTSIRLKIDTLTATKNIEAYLFVSARNHLYNHLNSALIKNPVAPLPSEW